MAKKVVLVVDMLKGFRNIGNLQNPRMERIIPNIVRLLGNEIRKGSKVIILRDYHKPDDKEFKMFPVHCVEGTEETEIIDELQKFLKVKGVTIINKTRYSGFQGTKLERVLRKKNPEEVIIVGVCTDICVLHTTIDLRSLDYNVIVLEDCVETYDAPESHPAEEISRWALNHMENILGAQVKQLQDVL